MSSSSTATAFHKGCKVGRLERHTCSVIDQQVEHPVNAPLVPQSPADMQWTEVLNRYNQSVPEDLRFWRLLYPLDRNDPRCREIQRANRRMFVDLLKKEVAEPGDTFLLCMLAISSCTVLIAPHLGLSIALAPAVLAVAAWIRAWK